MRPHGRGVREQALTIYLALSRGRRTLTAVQRTLLETTGVHVSEFSLGQWRRRDGWIEAVEKQDAMIRERILCEAVQRRARGVNGLLAAYEEVAWQALDRIRKEIDVVRVRNVADLRTLVSIAIDLEIRAEVLIAAVRCPERKDGISSGVAEVIARYCKQAGLT